jgi:two-component system cell cycle response regulator
MAYELCHRFGFHDQTRQERLNSLGLSAADLALGKQLHAEVIYPNVSDIVAAFYDRMMDIPEFAEILGELDLAKLKRTQADYLLSLGIDFGTADYFENRLRIGITHAQVGIPLSLYECAYLFLKENIIRAFPASLRNNVDKFVELNGFLNRITTLDMSLAVETYHLSKVQTLKRALKSMEQLDAELRHKVATDALTGVASHGQCLSSLGRAIKVAQRKEIPLCVSMVDLDKFKRVNDTYGHQVGDDVLCDIAGRMQGAVRNFDTVGRYGGEEFLIIMDNADKNTALEIAERVRYRVASSPVKTRSTEVNMTVSLGITELRPDDNIDSLIKRADEALYNAKHRGRNQVAYL